MPGRKAESTQILEYVATGDEVLHGHIVNTNASWLARTLFDAGLSLSRHTVIGDDVDEIASFLRERGRKGGVLIVSGGLGPTSDDLTASAAALAAETELTLNEACLQHVKSRNKTSSLEPVTKYQLRQALIPATAKPLINKWGSACGFTMKIGVTECIFLPGVPYEFTNMVTDTVLPLLQKMSTLSRQQCMRMTVFGLPESHLAQLIEESTVPEMLPPDVSVGYRVQGPLVEIKLTGSIDHEVPMKSAWRAIKMLVERNMWYEGAESASGYIIRLLTTAKTSLVIKAAEHHATLLTELIDAIPQGKAPTDFTRVILGSIVELNLTYGSLQEILEEARVLAKSASDSRVVAVVTGVSATDPDNLFLAIAEADGEEFAESLYLRRERRLATNFLVYDLIRRCVLRLGFPAEMTHGYYKLRDTLGPDREILTAEEARN